MAFCGRQSVTLPPPPGVNPGMVPGPQPPCRLTFPDSVPSPGSDFESPSCERLSPRALRSRRISTAQHRPNRMTEAHSLHLRSSPSPRLRPKRWHVALAILGVVTTGVLVDHATERAGRPAALEDAKRIWWDPPKDVVASLSESGAKALRTQPRAFWAIRDFELGEQQLVVGSSSARLVVLGDPELLVYWNGLLVHSHRYRQGQAAVVLDVSTLMEARNRVVLEGRSENGDGGMIAALWLKLPLDGSPDPSDRVWVTDGTWETIDHFDAGLLRGRTMIAPEQSGTPRLFGDLDLGHWQPLEIAPVVISPSWPSQRRQRSFPIARTDHLAVPADGNGGERVDLSSRADRDEAPGRPAKPQWPNGEVVEFAAGTTGCLAVAAGESFPRRIFFADSLDQLTLASGPQDYLRATGGAFRENTWVLPVPQGGWLSAAPRRFGAVFLEGLAAQPAGPKSGRSSVSTESSDPSLASGREAEPTIWVQPCAAPPSRAVGPTDTVPRLLVP